MTSQPKFFKNTKLPIGPCQVHLTVLLLLPVNLGGMGTPMGPWQFAFLPVDTRLAAMLSPEIVKVYIVEPNKDWPAGKGSWNKLKTVWDHS